MTIDPPSVDEETQSAAEPDGCIEPPEMRFGKIGIAAVAAALAASRADGIEAHRAAQAKARCRQAMGADAQSPNQRNEKT